MIRRMLVYPFIEIMDREEELNTEKKNRTRKTADRTKKDRYLR